MASLISVVAQTDKTNGVQYFKGTWTELLKEARQKNKLIFLDVYTDWCAPCKFMDEHVFTNTAVAGKYNSLFVNYRINAEKGEGTDLAKKFNVGAYPTLLFLNSSGYLIQREVGEREAGPLINIADNVFKQGVDKNNLGNLEQAFNEGNRDTLFLKNYITQLTRLDMDNNPVLDAWFQGMSFQALAGEENMLFLGQHIRSPKTAAFAFFIDHYDQLNQNMKDQLNDVLFTQLVQHFILAAIQDKDFLELKQLLLYVDKLLKLNAGQRYFLDRALLVYFDQVRDNQQVKATGYRLTKGLLEISIDSIRAEDARRYKAIMLPFLTGEKDSTQLDMKEERKYILNLYSREISSKLYTVAQRFGNLPDSETTALKDALTWIHRAYELTPEKPIAGMAEKLEKRVASN